MLGSTLSYPKAIQLLRDQGGIARRRSWSPGKYISLGLVPWNGEQKALLIHRYKDGRSEQSGSVVVLFVAFDQDVRAVDWVYEPEQVEPHMNEEQTTVEARNE